MFVPRALVPMAPDRVNENRRDNFDANMLHTRACCAVRQLVIFLATVITFAHCKMARKPRSRLDLPEDLSG